MAIALPLLGLGAGLLLGLALRVNLPIDWARYTAVGILAALDSLLGAFRAELEGQLRHACLSPLAS